MAESLPTGARAIVQGNAELEHWTDRDGKVERTSKRIVANHVGAELRFATVEVTRARRQGPAPEEPDHGKALDEEPF